MAGYKALKAEYEKAQKELERVSGLAVDGMKAGRACSDMVDLVLEASDRVTDILRRMRAYSICPA